MSENLKIIDVLEVLNEIAPFENCESYDNVGLMVGNPDDKVTKIGAVLDITTDVVQYAAKNQIDLIVSHHPVIFNSLRSVDKNSAVYSLVQNSIGAIACHTNLDNTGFVNISLADKLSLKNAQIMSDGHTVCAELPDYMEVSQAAEYIKNHLGTSGVSYLGKGNVRKIALSSGAGFDSIKLSKECGAELLLTSDVKHSAFIEAVEMDMPLVCADHFDTENPLVEPLAKLIGRGLMGKAEVKIIPQQSFVKHI